MTRKRVISAVWLAYAFFVLVFVRPWERGWGPVLWGLAFGLTIMVLVALLQKIEKHFDVGEARFDRNGKLIKDD